MINDFCPAPNYSVYPGHALSASCLYSPALFSSDELTVTELTRLR